MGKVIYRKKASKALRRIPQKIAQRFHVEFTKIANGNEDKLNIKKLKGRDGYRLRLGNYRGIYELEGSKMQIRVIVFNVGSRGDVYK